jgi:hypothetical protein
MSLVIDRTAVDDGHRPAVFCFIQEGDAMFREMKTYAHLKPGQDGTKRLVEQYGDALLCVRYRFDETRGVKVKTA